MGTMSEESFLSFLEAATFAGFAGTMLMGTGASNHGTESGLRTARRPVETDVA